MSGFATRRPDRQNSLSASTATAEGVVCSDHARADAPSHTSSGTRMCRTFVAMYPLYPQTCTHSPRVRVSTS